MNYTTKLNLRKPEATDVAEVHTHIGENAQILDDVLKGILEGTQAIDKIKLKIGTADVLGEGEMSFDEENGTISYGMAGGVIQQIGEEIFYKIKNQTGATLLDGKAIRSDGSLGLSANMKGKYAIADGTMPPRYILGVSTQDIANGADGRVTFFGVVRGINTTGADVGETWAAGDLLYVHPTVAGAMTKVPPTAPKPKIILGMVLTVSATVGAIFVKPDMGFSLEDLHNMYITSLADGDILTYDGVNLRWKNIGKNSVFSFLTNIGDLIYASAAGVPARLPAGTLNKILKSGGTTNAPVWEDIGLVVNGLASKATPLDADSIMVVDSAASNVGKKSTFTQIKAFLKTYFDTLYNNYVHPANHPASIITQDTSNRFVTDIEKTSWSAKANKSTEVTYTLLASAWVGSVAPFTCEFTVVGVTTTSIQEIHPDLNINIDQLKAFQKGNIVDNGQAVDTIKLKAFGIKPAYNVPLRIILRGDK